MNNVVLDASALLAVLRKERGADVVERHLDGATLSTVNYSEVLKKAVEKGGSVQEAATVIQGLQLDLIPFDERQALLAAELFAKTKSKGLSFADRACLTLATVRGLPVLTGDRDWLDIPTGLDIRCFR